MAGRILLIDDNESRRQRLADLLARARYSVCQRAPGAALTGDPAPDLVIVSGSTVIDQALGAVGMASEAPVLVLDDATAPRSRLIALRGGAREVAPSEPGALLLAQVRRLLRESDTQRERARRRRAAMGLGLREDPAGFSHPRRIAYIDTGGGRPIALSGLSAGVTILDSDAALDDCAAGKAPELYILDATGPGAATVLELLPELRSRPHSRLAAMLVLYTAGDAATAVSALNLGAGDLMMSDGGPDELDFRIRALLARKDDQDSLRRSTETSFELAATDPLTGLYNRRYAEAYLDDALAQSKRERQAVALLMLDVDHFKQVNDRYGHAVGDAVLSEIAARMRDNLRGSDLIARFGGEEFLVVMPDTGVDRAGAAADRLLSVVGEAPVAVDGLRVTATVSIGVAVGHPAKDVVTAGALIRQADAALYRAKTAGRNRVDAPAAA